MTKSTLFTLVVGKLKTKFDTQYNNDVGLYELNIYCFVLYRGLTPSYYLPYSLYIIHLLEHFVIFYFIHVIRSLKCFKIEL